MVPPSPNAAQEGPRAELFVLSGPDVGRSFAIAPGSTLGRAPDRDVALRDRSISRHHAHFEFAAGTWFIADDGSTNGFIVDGQRQARAALTDLRDFVVGEVLVRLRVHAPDATAPAAPRALAATRPSEPEEPQEIEDEIVLEDAPTDSPPPRPAPEPAPRIQPRVEPLPARPAAMAARSDAGLTARGQRPLQYHRQEARSGVLITDLAQQPLWLRAILVVLVVAVAVALGWGVYRGVLSLREGGAASSEVPEDA